jgi:EAL domain-containing protein (putative c-di-GMP-specific phosphodiesterase class I)
LIVGAEALLRCTYPELAEIGPADFLPIAERSGLMRSIDLMVIGLVCEIVADLEASNLILPISVNLSPDSLRQAGFGQMALNILGRFNLTGAHILFELTEGTMIDQESVAHENISILLAAGYQFSVDDFGTGYSSFSYLQQLKLSEIKIDRSFVHSLGSQSDSSDAVVHAILAMANALGLRSVAEGIETIEQVEWLREHGCQDGQGHYFSKAIAPANLIRSLQQDRETRNPPAYAISQVENLVHCRSEREAAP